jgi:hypothetical protein
MSPYFNKAQRHEGVLEEWRYSSTHSLTSALDGGKWSASRPGRFTSRERVPGTHWIGGWVGPRAVLDAWFGEKFPVPVGSQTPEPQSSSPLPSAIPTELSRLLIIITTTTTTTVTSVQPTVLFLEKVKRFMAVTETCDTCSIHDTWYPKNEQT